MASTGNFLGCGKSSTTVAVHGRVLFRGEPLTSGSVTFFPARGRPGNAPLSADGNFNIKVEPGEYIVTVSASEPLPPGFKEGDPMPKPKFVLPDQYTTRTKSTLKVTVTSDISSPLEFKLN